MGLTSALSVGQSALYAYQAALTVIGQNIANAGTPGYSRNVAQLSPLAGNALGNGQLGAGVRLDGVSRRVSESLNARLRLAGADVQSAQAQRASLSQVEGIFDPLGAFNLGSVLGEFFKSVSALQNTPENAAARGLVISNAQNLAQHFQSVRQQIVGLRSDLDAQVEQATAQADQLATRIAELNTRITTSEASAGGSASALRDERDRLLGQLSELFAITVREQPSGAVNVYIGSQALVQFSESFGLKAASEIGDDNIARVVVRFKIDNGPVTASSGAVAGLIAARDGHAQGLLNRLDSLAAAVIDEFNRVHAGGQGLSGFSTLTGATYVTDPSQALSLAGNGVDFPPRSGSFFIDVKDQATGTVVRTQINIDLDGIGTDTTLADLAADITANVAGVTATVLGDGRLQLSAAAGTTFTFADDTSGVLAALGINTFFTGRDAQTIGVNSLVAENVNLVSASTSGLPGDGGNAAALAALAEKSVTALGGVSLASYYDATIADIAVRSSSAQGVLDAGSIIFDSLTVQRESLSGVNLDEEAVAMISYQRAYEGAARFMSIVDDMLKTLLSLVS